jgi:hypothetical protein
MFEDRDRELPSVVDKGVQGNADQPKRAVQVLRGGDIHRLLVDNTAVEASTSLLHKLDNKVPVLFQPVHHRAQAANLQGDSVLYRDDIRRGGVGGREDMAKVDNSESDAQPLAHNSAIDSQLQQGQLDSDDPQP